MRRAVLTLVILCVASLRMTGDKAGGAGVADAVTQRGSNDTASLIDGQRNLREMLLSDRQRPVYHFVSPEGACVPFDPNGAIFWNGQYHLFYIFQDKRGHCWGHVSSKDLLHWRWHLTALAPKPGDPDTGIFSGNCFVNKKGEATILYHGISAGNCIATSSDKDLAHWTKRASNPVIPKPAPGSEAARLCRFVGDGFGWLENDTYYAVTGTVSLFKADTLDKWKYVGPFFAHDMPDVESGEDRACPHFCRIGDKYLFLCICHSKGTRYYLGDWKNNQFYPNFHARMNWDGGYCFAPSMLVDGKGRHVMWAWVEDCASQAPMTEGWSGVMTLPRILSLRDGGGLHIEPAEELKQLRMNPKVYEHVTLRNGASVPLEGVSGDCVEIAMTVKPGDAKRIGLRVRRSPDGSEQTPITFDLAQNQIRVDVSKSTLNDKVKYYARSLVPVENNHLVTEQVAPFALAKGKTLDVRVFLDHSIIEIYANGKQCVTQRVYPTRDDSLGIEFFCEGGGAEIESLQAWEMAPTNAW
jgi:beta-fructofuranosidase